jgi:uncharacterized protein (TIGR02246 family)
MASDEREIRTVHSIWIDAVNAGDLARLLTLVAEDVVFLTPGQAPFDRASFSSHFMATSLVHHAAADVFRSAAWTCFTCRCLPWLSFVHTQC